MDCSEKNKPLDSRLALSRLSHLAVREPFLVWHDGCRLPTYPFWDRVTSKPKGINHLRVQTLRAEENIPGSPIVTHKHVLRKVCGRAILFFGMLRKASGV